nr:23S rRNA (uracil(1939)-C(5))-methyltransferase RlmD [uncultured Ruminococcus sp.]
MAWLLQKNYHDAGRQAGRGAKPERLYVLSHTLMPAVLTEVGFLSNIEDEAYMTSKRGQKEIATCIYKALAEYYETTQAKTHKKTLTRLRNSNGKTSGLSAPQVAQAEEPKSRTEEAKAKPASEGQKKDAPLAAGDTTEEVVKEVVEEVAEKEAPSDSVFTSPQDVAGGEAVADQPALAGEETPAEDVGPIQPSSTIPVFSIQIVAVSSELRSDDDRLQGLFPVTFVKSGNMYKGLYGGTTDYRQAKKTLADIREKFPEITTIVQNINPYQTNLVLGDRENVLYGKGYIEDILCGCRFRISPKSFYQINPVQTEVLYSTAIKYADLKGDETVLDTYCGIGTIGIIAAKNGAGKVIGVELNGDAVRDAIVNAKANGLKNIRFYKGDAGDFMRAAADEDEKPDVVFMDPPRAGSSEVFLDSLIKMSPKTVVYVSCSPETMARDLRYLEQKSKYSARKIQPVDMFPHTNHIECVALITKQNGEKL